MENNSLNLDFNDGVLRVAIVGEINHHNAVFVRQGIDEKIQELRPQNLVLDLADAPFMDSSGLGLIMGRYQLMKDLGGPRKCKRYKTIKVQYQILDMQTRTKNFTGWTAQIIQHEIDHCNGVLI